MKKNGILLTSLVAGLLLVMLIPSSATGGENSAAPGKVFQISLADTIETISSLDPTQSLVLPEGVSEDQMACHLDILFKGFTNASNQKKYFKIVLKQYDPGCFTDPNDGMKVFYKVLNPYENASYDRTARKLVKGDSTTKLVPYANEAELITNKKTKGILLGPGDAIDADTHRFFLVFFKDRACSIPLLNDDASDRESMYFGKQFAATRAPLTVALLEHPGEGVSTQWLQTHSAVSDHSLQLKGGKRGPNHFSQPTLSPFQAVSQLDPTRSIRWPKGVTVDQLASSFSCVFNGYDNRGAPDTFVKFVLSDYTEGHLVCENPSIKVFYRIVNPFLNAARGDGNPDADLNLGESESRFIPLGVQAELITNAAKDGILIPAGRKLNPCNITFFRVLFQDPKCTVPLTVEDMRSPTSKFADMTFRDAKVPPSVRLESRER